jgi:uncharacterized protein (TIGR03118 family)
LSPAVTIPTDGSSGPSGPTGVVQNTHAGEFLISGPDGISVAATYIFDTLQGTIEGYNGIMVNTSSAGANPNSAEIMVNNSSTAEYTGLAVGTYDGTSDDGPDYIYAVNEGTNPGIQVFNDSFQQVPLGPGPIGVKTFDYFIDPDLPAGFIPYGVRDLSLGTSPKQDDLYVTYRSPNFQGGAVAEFTNSGTFVTQLGYDTTSTGPLQSPWGLAFYQHAFGEFSGDLLVGNFSSGQIDAYAYNTTSGQFEFKGQFHNAIGTVLEIPGLRSIHFGPGLGAGTTQVALLFTAEIDNGNLSLYGEITPVATSAKWLSVDPYHTLYVYGDQSLATNDTISVETNGIDGGVLVTMDSESIFFPNGEISAIDINPLTGANTVSVLNTNVPVTIYDFRSDRVQIGNSDDGLQGIKADVDLANSYSLVNLTITDANDSIGHGGVILNSDGLLGMSPLPIQWDDDSINKLSIYGGSGGDTFFVSNTPSVDTNIYPGSDSSFNYVNVLGTTGRLNVDESAGVTTVNVGNSLNELNSIQGPVDVSGGAGNHLIIDDQNNTANDTYSIGTGAIKRRGAAKITYAGVSTVTLDGGSGNETFEIMSLNPAVQFAITGGVGVNTLDYGSFNGNITVDLPLGLATGLTGGISNIQNVTGSKGNDILVGDANPNVLIGGTGRNLIIGGMGADRLIGRSNGDIMIGDYTDYDTNIAALDAIMAEWDSNDSYSTRCSRITGGGGLNGSHVLNATTVHNDSANDTMTGGAGRDWYFASSGDTLTDAVTGGPNKEDITTI